MVDIRWMQEGEAEALGRVMWSAIHHGASRYTPAERLAWLPAPHQSPEWAAMLNRQTVWVASADAQPVGFMTLADKGYIDLAFAHARAQGQGVFSQLLSALEAHAKSCGVARLWTHASLMAEAAFTARGFRVIARETVERAGQTLARAKMEKVLK